MPRLDLLTEKELHLATILLGQKWKDRRVKSIEHLSRELRVSEIFLENYQLADDVQDRHSRDLVEKVIGILR